MQRREFIKSTALCGAVAAVGTLSARPEKSTGRFLRGKVAKNDGPVVGVVVTDGLQCVRTDEKGEFVIPERPGARFVSVTVPSGYQCADFYYPVSRATKSYYFWLSPIRTRS